MYSNWCSSLSIFFLSVTSMVPLANAEDPIKRPAAACPGAAAKESRAARALLPRIGNGMVKVVRALSVPGGKRMSNADREPVLNRGDEQTRGGKRAALFVTGAAAVGGGIKAYAVGQPVLAGQAIPASPRRWQISCPQGSGQTPPGSIRPA